MRGREGRSEGGREGLRRMWREKARIRGRSSITGVTRIKRKKYIDKAANFSPSFFFFFTN